MAIATKYDGIEYRSRLEARWAAFMRNIGWDITYEPFDGDGYIPDFLVQGPSPMLIEVKPAVTQAEYEAAVPKAEAGLAPHWQHDILIVGATPFPDPMGCSWDQPTAGWLGQYDNYWYEEVPGELRIPWGWEAAEWATCLNCKRIMVYHTEMSFNGRPCGCHDGNSYLGRPNMRLLQSMWADACNDVKWRGRAA